MQISVDDPVMTVEMSRPALPALRHPECGSHSGPRWYCGQAKAGQIFPCRDHLIRQGFEVLVPLTARRTLAGILITPLLGPYFLIRLDLALPGWRRVASTRGVARLFGPTPERPSPLRDADVARLRALTCDGLGEPPAIGSGIGPGQPLRAETGPRRGQTGLCLDVVSITVRALWFGPAGPEDADYPLRWCSRP